MTPTRSARVPGAMAPRSGRSHTFAASDVAALNARAGDARTRSTARCRTRGSRACCRCPRRRAHRSPRMRRQVWLDAPANFVQLVVDLAGSARRRPESPQGDPGWKTSRRSQAHGARPPRSSCRRGARRARSCRRRSRWHASRPRHHARGRPASGHDRALRRPPRGSPRGVERAIGLGRRDARDTAGREDLDQPGAASSVLVDEGADVVRVAHERQGMAVTVFLGKLHAGADQVRDRACPRRRSLPSRRSPRRTPAPSRASSSRPRADRRGRCSWRSTSARPEAHASDRSGCRGTARSTRAYGRRSARASASCRPGARPHRCREGTAVSTPTMRSSSTMTTEGWSVSERPVKTPSG